MSNKKRVGFLIFVIMIFLFNFLPIVYAQLPAHCSNNIPDSSLGETGKDCGGSCFPCPIDNPFSSSQHQT